MPSPFKPACLQSPNVNEEPKRTIADAEGAVTDTRREKELDETGARQPPLGLREARPQCAIQLRERRVRERRPRS